MSYIPIEMLLDKAENSLYKLVIVASKRALEVAEGSPKLVEADSNVKNTTVALREISENKVRMKKS
ncbi:MAG: DNA-directed RNA polymerase subunit omega [Candidatus Omnitrophica bacterium]|nr:DNA-directed RNA polymerase subunit omega [Candidatus Omnitrophota bacterium]MDD5351600.1 DNA-directed RNA polymerase subunit omega [Candidatus Omnitrophota bacterium]MDD5550809.1 DNA-directed RNA polymerase subunit omega [Candidatus Omnitrophota bacterium]